MSDKQTSRFLELDALRGIAALFVVFYHYTNKYDYFFTPNSPAFCGFYLGVYGVPLFFIISGFVIYLTVERSKNAFDFAWKRASRLYPVFWICVIITFLGVNLVGSIPELKTSWFEGVLNLTMFYRILRVFTDINDVDGAYWSLFPELQFYLLIFLTMLVGKIKYIKWISLFWLILILIENFIFHIPILGLVVNLQTGALFVAGIMLYRIMFYKENNLLNHFIIFLTLLINYLIFSKIKEYPFPYLAFPLIYAVFYLFIYGKLKFLNNKILIYMGAISYPLYLIHQNLGYLIIRDLRNLHYSSYIIVPLVIFIFIIIASILTFYIERPFLKRLRNVKLFKS